MRESASATVVVALVLVLFLGMAFFLKRAWHQVSPSDPYPRATMSRSY